MESEMETEHSQTIAETGQLYEKTRTYWMPADGNEAEKASEMRRKQKNKKHEDSGVDCFRKIG